MMSVIDNFRKIRPENIDWKTIGARARAHRCYLNQDIEEAAHNLGLTKNELGGFERASWGTESDERKTVNIIWRVVWGWNISINWLLNGIGNFYDTDPMALVPSTLPLEKGAGIRRDAFKSEAETGTYGEQLLEFILAIDKFKDQKMQLTDEKHIPWSQAFQILLALGYRKAVPSTIAPLGYFLPIEDYLTPQIKEKIRRQKIKRSNDERRLKKQLEEKNKLLEQKKQLRSARKVYLLTAPDGTKHQTSAIRQFSEKHGLEVNNLYSVAKGIRKHHKGWTVQDLGYAKFNKTKKHAKSWADWKVDLQLG